MRDLIKAGRAQSLRLAASMNGWRRRPVANPDPDGPVIRWEGPGGVIYRSDDPEALAEPLRQAVRCSLIAFFSRKCPVCAARAQWLSQRQAATGDLARFSLTRFERVADGQHSSARVVFAIEHEAECPVRPEHIDAMIAAASN